MNTNVPSLALPDTLKLPHLWLCWLEIPGVVILVYLVGIKSEKAVLSPLAPKFR